MSKRKFSVEQIVSVLKQAEVGAPIAELIRKVGVTEQTYYRWKSKYAGLEVDQVRQIKRLRDENTRLKPRTNPITGIENPGPSKYSVSMIPTGTKQAGQTSQCSDKRSAGRSRLTVVATAGIRKASEPMTHIIAAPRT